MFSTQDYLSIFKASLALVAIVVVGWVVIVRLQRWMKSDADSSEAFTLDDLRRLRREGRLSEAEFAKAREAMIGSVRAKNSANVSAKDLGKQGSDSGVERVLPSTLKPASIEHDGRRTSQNSGGEQRPLRPMRPRQLDQTHDNDQATDDDQATDNE